MLTLFFTLESTQACGIGYFGSFAKAMFVDQGLSLLFGQLVKSSPMLLLKLRNKPSKGQMNLTPLSWKIKPFYAHQIMETLHFRRLFLTRTFGSSRLSVKPQIFICVLVGRWMGLLWIIHLPKILSSICLSVSGPFAFFPCRYYLPSLRETNLYVLSKALGLVVYLLAVDIGRKIEK